MHFSTLMKRKPERFCFEEVQQVSASSLSGGHAHKEVRSNNRDENTDFVASFSLDFAIGVSGVGTPIGTTFCFRVGQKYKHP